MSPPWSHVAGMGGWGTAWIVLSNLRPFSPAVTIAVSIVGMVMVFAAGWMVGRVGRGGAS